MTQPLPDEQPVDVAEMAHRLGVSPYTVRKYARNGDIPGFKFRKGNARAEWRFYPSVVVAHLTAPPADDWQQSPQSRGRRRTAAA